MSATTLWMFSRINTNATNYVYFTNPTSPIPNTPAVPKICIERKKCCLHAITQDDHVIEVDGRICSLSGRN